MEERKLLQSYTWHRAPTRPRRALFVSSSIGLGHIYYDLAVPMNSGLERCAYVHNLYREVPNDGAWRAARRIASLLSGRGPQV